MTHIKTLRVSTFKTYSKPCRMEPQQQNAQGYVDPAIPPLRVLIHLQLQPGTPRAAVVTQPFYHDARTSFPVPHSTRRMWATSLHRPKVCIFALARRTWSSRGLQRKDHMPMARLPCTPSSAAKHGAAYSVDPSRFIKVEVSAMLEDILAEGDGTTLSPSRCPWLDDMAGGKVRQSPNGIPFLMEDKRQPLGGEDGTKQARMEAHRAAQ